MHACTHSHESVPIYVFMSVSYMHACMYQCTHTYMLYACTYV